MVQSEAWHNGCMATSADAILDGLDEAQRAAATAVDGPVRIVAVAGAGKTRTVTRRIAYACAIGWVLMLLFEVPYYLFYKRKHLSA